MNRRHAQGLTLIEVLVAVAIAAIMVGLAAPSFVQTLARSRLEGVATTLAMDIQYTRSEAIRRGGKHADTTLAGATLTIAADGASYAITVTPASGAADVTMKTVTLPTGVTLAQGQPIRFESLRGTTAAQSFEASSDLVSTKLQVSINALGRVAMCSPSGVFSGYPSC
ncbi:GspH/FimT family pseudopilin [Aquabacterium sp.]|uniref:GspH/FimT family pseudopilin n=1 Tax=Aquabacterium sp. TaxID=1872578 RepID=UPI002C66D7A1|nr:GspH/FimT family pseudopilin [Aquabacterium sp.]HSW05753.1 GspH/FimT family pseudopilin [Aquabacterium sp.]